MNNFQFIVRPVSAFISQKKSLTLLLFKVSSRYRKKFNVPQVMSIIMLLLSYAFKEMIVQIISNI